MGLEYIEVYRDSINKAKFKTFLEDLRARYPFDDILLVMDNLSIHRSNNIKERMEELGFKYAYTPAYSPTYNGIEEVINMGKQRIKKQRLEGVLNEEKEDLRELIIRSFEGLDAMSISKCINRSLALLNLTN